MFFAEAEMGILGWIFGADDFEESQLEDMILMDIDEEEQSF